MESYCEEMFTWLDRDENMTQAMRSTELRKPSSIS